MMRPKSISQKKALRLQRKILRSLKAEAELLLGQTPQSILNYGRENRRDFSLNSKRLRTVPKADLIQAIKTVDVTFIADFHTFDQAQRSALRIFRETIQPGHSWMIGLEMIPSQFQNALDDFQARKISVQKFHELISYREEWGFPWANYAPIFDWARTHGVRLIALNRPRAVFRPTLRPFFLPEDERELHERDEWAAGIITDLFCEAKDREGNTNKGTPNKPAPNKSTQATPEGTTQATRNSQSTQTQSTQGTQTTKMFVFYGELHVGRRHLPYQLEKISKPFLKHPLSSVIVHQNDDRLFWRATKENVDLQNEAVLLKKNIYCIFSGTPWAKLQSLISWTEGGAPDLNETENDAENAFLAHDYLYMIRTYGDMISEFLSLTPPSYEALNVYTIEQPDFLDHLNEGKLFTQQELRLIRFHITHNRYCYIPRVSAAYLGSSSLNAAAELAAIHILRAKSQSNLLYSNKVEDFYRLILEACFGFFGSLILNPMRKCDFLKDHIQRLQTLKSGEKPAFPLEIKAREILIQGLEAPDRLTTQISEIMGERKLAPAVMIGARYLGRVLGKKLHHAVLSEKIRFKNIEGVFLDKPTPAKHFFETRHKILLEAISEVAPKELGDELSHS